eukprot:CAMPEP_0178376222 /NCGR_PEP_ID=MMETSP0689_2-20121128/3290_1 /TAXON_ID=160604 /ORGANISM="Amphidinium massartii, Strain CS-259" /LENGTH=630 /DNA_ID=CAMNT_0019996235 /DNA_START=119 /DNA_END=2011 /DNA_ORIENTATION=-
MRATNVASTRETRTAEPRVNPPLLGSRPAERVSTTTEVAARALAEVEAIQANVAATSSCTELPQLVTNLRELSRKYSLTLERLASMDSKRASADSRVIARVGSSIAKAFGGVWKQVQTRQLWCPEAATALVVAMQGVNEDWLRVHRVAGLAGLESARSSASEWASLFTTAAESWQQVTRDTPHCEGVPIMMGVMQETVTSVASAVHSWVGHLEQMHASGDDMVEVMTEWLRPVDACLVHAKDNTLEWSHVCGSSDHSIPQAQSASIASANFMKHFSGKSLLMMQDWVQAFATCSEQCSAAAEQASILAASTVRPVSGIAQVSHAWSMSFAKSGDAVEESSQVWAETFKQLLQDSQEESVAWSKLFQSSPVAATSVSDAWASSLQFLSVALQVAVEGWTDKDVIGYELQNTQPWAEASAILLRSAGESSRLWAQALDKSSTDKDTIMNVLQSASTWAAALDVTVHHFQTIVHIATGSDPCKVSGQWAEAYAEVVSGTREGTRTWMALVARQQVAHIPKIAHIVAEERRVAFESLTQSMVGGSMATLGAGMQFACETSYDQWVNAADKALDTAAGDLPLDANASTVGSVSFQFVLKEAMKDPRLRSTSSEAGGELLTRLCEQNPSLDICSQI